MTQILQHFVIVSGDDSFLENFSYLMEDALNYNTVIEPPIGDSNIITCQHINAKYKLSFERISCTNEARHFLKTQETAGTIFIIDVDLVKSTFCNNDPLMLIDELVEKKNQVISYSMNKPDKKLLEHEFVQFIKISNMKGKLCKDLLPLPWVNAIVKIL